MAPHEFVEIRLVCNADYLDPQLKLKLHQIKDQLREILHTGRRRFALKKVQPWNSVKVTFDIPKEAADRLRLLAVQGNLRLVELGILSVEIVGQSNAIVVKKTSTTNSINNKSTDETKEDSPHRTKRMKIENENDSTSKTPSVPPPPPPSATATAATSESNGLVHDLSTHFHPQTWTNANNYKMKVNGVVQRPNQFFHPAQQQSVLLTENSSSQSAHSTTIRNGPMANSFDGSSNIS